MELQGYLVTRYPGPQFTFLPRDGQDLVADFSPGDPLLGNNEMVSRDPDSPAAINGDDDWAVFWADAEAALGVT